MSYRDAFFLIFQEFLIFTNLNGQGKTCNFNPKLERSSKLLLSQLVIDSLPCGAALHIHFLILSRKSIETTLGSSCLKSGAGKTGLLLTLMISDQCRYTSLHHKTPLYAFISYIFIFAKFPDFCSLRRSLVITQRKSLFRFLCKAARPYVKFCPAGF